MSVPFTTGFNDFFQVLAYHPNATQIFDAARDFNGKTLRFTISWDVVEPQPGQYNFSYYDPCYQRALARGRRILPIIYGNAPSWVARDRRLRQDPQKAESVYYPLESGWAAFAQFVVRTVQHFDFFRAIDAVEIWNEPNHNAEAKAYVPASVYSGMFGHALNAMAATQQNGGFSKPITVVSGGLIMDGPFDYAGYFNAFKTQCYPFAFGIHPYEIRPHDNKTQSEAIVAVTDRITQRFDDAKQLYAGDLWVTETGCTSSPPLGLTGQAQALVNILGTGGTFAQRVRCKAGIVHRLFPDPASEPPGDPFYRHSVMNADLTYKQPTYTYLRSNWA